MAHKHKDIKELVMNVTQNTNEKLIGKKKRIKLKNIKHSPYAKLSPTNVQLKTGHTQDDLRNCPTKVNQEKYWRSLAPAFDQVEDSMLTNKNVEKTEV